MSKIVVLLIGDITHDGRVKKEINSLKSSLIVRNVLLIRPTSYFELPGVIISI